MFSQKHEMEQKTKNMVAGAIIKERKLGRGEVGKITAPCRTPSTL